MELQIFVNSDSVYVCSGIFDFKMSLGKVDHFDPITITQPKVGYFCKTTGNDNSQRLVIDSVENFSTDDFTEVQPHYVR